MGEIINLLTELSRLDLSSYPYEKAREIIQQLGKFGYIRFTLHQGATLIRARPNYNGERFFESSEYSYKPQKYNTTYQRASTPNRTMFYGCYLPEDQLEYGVPPRVVAALETLPWFRDPSTKGYQKVSYGRWEVIEDINLVAIVRDEKFQEANAYTKELAEALAKFMKEHADLDNETLAVSEFFAREFSKVKTDPDYHYLLSACFAEIVSEKGADGVLYPSVRADGKGYNVAILPEVADKNMRLVVAGECSLYKLYNNRLIANETTAELLPGQITFDLPATDAKYRIGQDECLKRLGIKSIDELTS